MTEMLKNSILLLSVSTLLSPIVEIISSTCIGVTDVKWKLLQGEGRMKSLKDLFPG